MGWVKENAIGGNGISAAKKVGLASVIGLAALSARSAQGALSLTLTEPGFAPVTGTVSGNTDTFIGTYGDFTTNIVVGVSNSTTPSNLAQLQIQSLNITSNTASSGHVLSIVFSDNGFTFPGVVGTNLLMTSTLGGTLTTPIKGDQVSFFSTASPSGGSTVNTTTQTFAAAASSPSTISLLVPPTTATFTQTGLYTLSNTITTLLSGAGETANLSGTTTVQPATVPEPVGMSVLAIGGLMLGRRRRSR